MLPSVVTKQTEVQSAVSAVAEQLNPDVQYIRYDIGQDWSGDWAIFFRIVLSNEASKKRLREIATQVVWRLGERIDFTALGVIPYHNFRSAAEQEILQEPAWMPTGPYQSGRIQ
jgi:hypothetical protein